MPILSATSTNSLTKDICHEWYWQVDGSDRSRRGPQTSSEGRTGNHSSAAQRAPVRQWDDTSVIDQMLGLVCLTAPPSHPHYFCCCYFWHYSCARSGIYNSALRLMQYIFSLISDNARWTSAGDFPRVGFSLFLGIKREFNREFFLFWCFETRKCKEKHSVYWGFF